jgi:hypothetical protein
VFGIQSGALRRFDEISTIVITGLSKQNGDRTKGATQADETRYADERSENVEPRGLLTGEPGTLLYVDPKGHPGEGECETPYLCLETYIDETEFNTLIERASRTTTSLAFGKMVAFVELFGHETDGSPTESCQRRVYGLLLRAGQETIGHTRARLESLSLSHTAGHQS